MRWNHDEFFFEDNDQDDNWILFANAPSLLPENLSVPQNLSEKYPSTHK